MSKRPVFAIAPGLLLMLIGPAVLSPLACGEECTTGLVAPAATAENRPLLWKNRDSSVKRNEVVLLNAPGVAYLALINADDTTQVWAGVNSFGFAIMNAESRDMAVPGTETGYDDEGYFMKSALMLCRTVDDFETTLKVSNPIGRNVTSNFGVIDAQGKAAFFETGNHEYFRYDADSANGSFLVRANFALRARSKEGYGRIRHDRARTLLNRKQKIAADYIITKVARDIELPDSVTIKDAQPPGWRKVTETVNRNRTVASAVFEGVKAGEDPRLSTFWLSLGEPAVALSIPLWTYAGRVPAALDSLREAPLNLAFRQVKACAYTNPQDQRVVNLEMLYRIQRKLKPAQKQIFKSTARKLKAWRKNPPSPTEVANFQDEMAALALRTARSISSRYAQ